ncbi:MAG: LEA type 2 family protein [Phycisphaerales bacterium JB059]
MILDTTRTARTLCFPAGVLVALTLGACSSPKAPTFEPVGVTAMTEREGELELIFTVQAANDNPDPLPLKRAAYTLSIDGAPVYSGVRSPETTLSEYSTHTFELPALVPLSYATRTDPAPYRLTGTVSYVTPGKLAETLFDSGVRQPEATINVAGTIDFSAAR